ncbi:F-box domain-containing protein [Mycena venus]|uniref:F-box domain-containing protein n=1 Tax=Mycena venus TaxID=2733690 RepID=A0A8H7D8R8_9AGAR|nr:F-box domain-containing protein [Mycena venus]
MDKPSEKREKPLTHNSLSSWSDLPVDILMVIMGFMAPHDILALRKVSKSLAFATCERSVWIERQTVSLVSIRYLDPAAWEEEFEHLRMMPGGRYVVTAAHCNLRLWDLGNYSKAPRMKLITSVTMHGVAEIHGLRIRLSQSTSDALVFVPTTGFDDISPAHLQCLSPAPAAQFCLVAPVLSLPVVDDFPRVIGFTNGHAAIYAGSKNVLWDFLHDRWIAWLHPSAGPEDIVYLCNNNIVIQSEAAYVYVASLSPLQPRFSSDAPPEIESLNNRSYPPVGGITLLFHGREISSFQNPLHVDIVSNNAPNVVITHFALLPGRNYNTTPCQLVSLGETPLGIPYFGTQSQLLEWVGPSMLLSFDLSDDGVFVSLMDMQVDGPGMAKAPLSGVLGTPGLLLADTNVDFCAFSGRRCARIPSDDGFKLMVMEYLMPKQI